MSIWNTAKSLKMRLMSEDDGSGHAAFLDPDVNRMIKKVLNEWGKYLQVCSFPFT